MNRRKEPFFYVRIGNAKTGTINPMRELRLMIGSLDIQIQFGGLFTIWRYCKKCGSILEPYGCSNPNCATHNEGGSHE
jgi:hypothetical protein